MARRTGGRTTAKHGARADTKLAERAEAKRERKGRPELGQLFDETVSLYLRLSALADRIYRRGELSGPRRTLLIALARSGPRTVAHLARARAQARQRLQPLVNALVEEGLLQTIPNPLHKQSHLVGLTARGEKVVRHMSEREGMFREQLQLASSSQRIVDAVEVLRDVRQALEAQAEEIVSR